MATPEDPVGQEDPAEELVALGCLVVPVPLVLGARADAAGEGERDEEEQEELDEEELLSDTGSLSSAQGAPAGGRDVAAPAHALITALKAPLCGFCRLQR